MNSKEHRLYGVPVSAQYSSQPMLALRYRHMPRASSPSQRRLDGNGEQVKRQREIPCDLDKRADAATCEHAWERHLWEGTIRRQPNQSMREGTKLTLACGQPDAVFTQMYVHREWQWTYVPRGSIVGT